jgi:hypothetical protein
VTLTAVLLGVVSAKLTGPLPAIADDTLTVSHVPLGNPPVAPSRAPTAGAVLLVVVVSPQVVLLTAWTSMPDLLAVSA